MAKDISSLVRTTWYKSEMGLALARIRTKTSQLLLASKYVPEKGCIHLQNLR